MTVTRFRIAVFVLVALFGSVAVTAQQGVAPTSAANATPAVYGVDLEIDASWLDGEKYPSASPNHPGLQAVRETLAAARARGEGAPVGVRTPWRSVMQRSSQLFAGERGGSRDHRQSFGSRGGSRDRHDGSWNHREASRRRVYGDYREGSRDHRDSWSRRGSRDHRAAARERGSRDHRGISTTHRVPSRARAVPVDPRKRNVIREHRRAPIPFRPIERRDPRTGRQIPPNTIVTLRRGRKITAAQFFAGLNEVERKLNAQGYSLRDPQNSVVVKELIPKPSAAPQPHMMANPAHHALGGASLATLQTMHQKGAALDASRLQALAGKLVAPGTLRTVKTWNPPPIGVQDVFTVTPSARLTLTGSSGLSNVHAEANADASFFGHGFPVLRATGDLNAPKTGAMNLHAELKLAGETVWTLTENPNASCMKSGTEARDMPLRFVEVDVYQIGPFSVSLELGARGNATVAYFASLRPLAATAVLSPSIRSSVYAQASLDIDYESDIAGTGGEAGVEGNLTLLNDDFSLWGQLELNVNAAGKPYFYEFYSANNSYDALGGSIVAYAEIYGDLPGDLLDWHKRWTFPIWSFSGYRGSQVLFSGSKKTYL